MVRHERLFVALSVVLVAWVVCGVALLAWVFAIPPAGRPPMLYPDWALPLVAFASGAYLAALVVALVLRRTHPDAGRRLTRVVNVSLLFAPPFGTALGLYGLWALDRTPRPAA
jgi:hypothetical protein